MVLQRLSRHGQPSGGAGGEHAAIAAHGAGAGGTRNISGTSPLHAALEPNSPRSHGKGGALLFGVRLHRQQAGDLAVLEALPGFIVFSDAKNHATMIAGMRGAKAASGVIWRTTTWPIWKPGWRRAGRRRRS